MPIGIFGPRASEQAAEIIRSGAEKVSAEQLEQLLNLARQAKPPGYQAHAQRIRNYYEGRQAAAVRSILAKRYPETHEDMSVFPMNVTRAAAKLDATAYRQDPTRALTFEGDVIGQKVTDPETGETSVLQEGELERKDRFEELKRLAALDVVVPEMERRTMAAETTFVRITWPRLAARLGREQRPKLALFWPGDVFVIPHPDAPGDLWAAHAIIALVGGPADSRMKGERWWEIWAREDVGAPIFVQVLSNRGRMKTPTPQLYANGELLEMPWAAMHSSLSQDSIFLDVNRDRAEVQDSVNVGMTNWWFKDDLQGHTERVIIGPEPKEGRTIVGGPGAWIQLPEDSDVESLNYQHDLTTLDGVEKTLRMFAVTLQQSPDAWATEPGPPQSGVSRIVMNIEPNEKRKERIGMLKAWEQNELLPRLVEVGDFWGRNQLGGTIGGEGVGYKVTFPPVPVFEEAEAQRLTAQLMEESGWLSPAEASVRGGARRTLEEAMSRGLSNDLRRAPAERPPGGGDRPGQAESLRPVPDAAPEEDAA